MFHSLNKPYFTSKLSRVHGKNYSILNTFCNTLMHRRGSQVRKMALEDVTEQHRLTQG